MARNWRKAEVDGDETAITEAVRSDSQKEKRLRYLIERYGENKGNRVFQQEQTSK